MGVQIQGDTGNVIATKGTFSGDVGIAGTLTYEDVTNIDSVGLVTARQGIEVGTGVGVAASISVDGNAEFAGIVTATQFVGNGANLTGVASTENIRTNTNATFLQNINVGVAITAGKLGIGFTDANVKVGNTALDSLTTGTNNTAVGHNALTANTTGSTNVAVGDQALEANTTASNNTAIGTQALEANTTGDLNVAVGSGSMVASTNADRNVAVGSNTLQNIAADLGDTHHTCIGFAAGQNITTGTQNTAIGLNSLKVNTTGTLNTAI